MIDAVKLLTRFLGIGFIQESEGWCSNIVTDARSIMKLNAHWARAGVDIPCANARRATVAIKECLYKSRRRSPIQYRPIEY
jgi:hypothetical protein